MNGQQWLILAVVVAVVAIVVYRRTLQDREHQERDRQSADQAQNQARSSAENISQREDRRLAGMTAEDRAWEQASLQRNRHAQAGTQAVEVSPELETHR